MSKLKLNVIDIGIIVVLIIVISAGGFYYLTKNKAKIVDKNQTKIEFDIEIQNLSLDNANSFLSGENVVYGMTNIDTGKVKNVKVEPYKRLTKDSVNGKYLWKTFQNRYQATVTIEATVNETGDSFRGEKEEVRIGTQMQFHGKGFASAEGYIVGLRKQ